MSDPRRPAVILDCDPGHDDAIAILLAARHCELLGVTSVSGNVPLERTTRNALVTLQLLGLDDVPVHVGAARPLVAEPRHAEAIHGHTGLDGPELPALAREPAGRDAVRFIVDTVRARDDVWLVATGPLTNVALALREAPDIAARLRGVSVMGGSTSFGNTTPAAEFNILFDPEAAAATFGAGVRLLMAGLNLSHQFLIDPARLARIRGLGTAASRFVADLMHFYAGAYAEAFTGRREGPLHDPCAVLVLTHPELFEIAPMHVEIELTGTHTRGMTVADQRRVRTGAPPNVEVLTRIDAPAAFEVLLATIGSYA